MNKVSPQQASILASEIYSINTDIKKTIQLITDFGFVPNAFDILKDNINVALSMDIANA